MYTGKEKSENNVSISQIVKLTGVSASLLRKYENAGLLQPKRNEENKYRQYNPEDISRILEIRMLRKLGIPLENIYEILAEKDSPSNPGFFQQYQAELREKMRHMQSVDYFLSHVINAIKSKGNALNYCTLPPQIFIAYMASLTSLEELADMQEEAFAKFKAICCPDISGAFQGDQRFGHLPGGKYAFLTIEDEEKCLGETLQTVIKEIYKNGHTVDGKIIAEINYS